MKKFLEISPSRLYNFETQGRSIAYLKSSLLPNVIVPLLPEKRMGGAGFRLLTAFKKWAENRRAVELNAGIYSGTDLAKFDRYLYKKDSNKQVVIIHCR